MDAFRFVDRAISQCASTDEYRISFFFFRINLWAVSFVNNLKRNNGEQQGESLTRPARLSLMDTC